MFPCTGCGACCKHIENSIELKDFNLGNGTCKYLDTIDNSCKIYDKRPDICKVDKMFEIEYYKTFSRKNFYVKNAEVCNYLQDLHSIDKSYRLNIKDIKCYLG